MSWDYIIIGAGSAGCALAYELVKTGRTVLLLEAGGSNNSPYIKFPAFLRQAGEKFDWGYRSEAEPHRPGASENWKRGRVVGGTSSINGMVLTRGAAADYDRWAKLCDGEGGWSGSQIMPLFRDMETSDQPGSARGKDGRLFVRTVKRPHAVTQAYMESVRAAGYRLNPDCNSGDPEGFGLVQLTQRAGLRWSAADAFLKPCLGRKNFKLIKHCLVEKVEIEGDRVRAVVYRENGTLHRQCAGKFILSAGAINSPKLLMLSGIGDRAELSELGIAVKADLPAVGRNLKEHPRVTLMYRSRIATYSPVSGPLHKIGLAMKYLLHRQGPIASPYESMAFVRSSADVPAPDLQIFFAPVGFEGSGRKIFMPYPSFKIVVAGGDVASSGRVRLASADPAAKPLIESGLLRDEADVLTLVRGLQIVRSIVSAEPLASLIEAEVSPGNAVRNEDELAEYVRLTSHATCQPVGTCRMGVGLNTVVDPSLRVNGIANLWIADASINPCHLAINTNGPSMIIGKKLGRHLAAERA